MVFIHLESQLLEHFVEQRSFFDCALQNVILEARQHKIDCGHVYCLAWPAQSEPHIANCEKTRASDFALGDADQVSTQLLDIVDELSISQDNEEP
jgi:hypothetical protein